MKSFLALFFILLFGGILRLYQLGVTPLALEWDEVALGYDAYSVLHTGKDQFGEFLPITFRSLDDWKPPLYVYAALPGIFLFGLTDFATRLPAALFGIIGIFLTYKLVQELFATHAQSRLLALISAFFLAISPWHLQFSRAAFETNLSVTVTLAAVLCFLKGMANKRLFLLSAFFFGLALFSYHSTRVVTPILLVSLLFFLRDRLPERKTIALFLGIYAIFVYFFLPLAKSPDAQIRFRVTNDLRIDEYTQLSAEKILTDGEQGNDVEFAGRIFHNRRIAIFTYENAKRILYNYLLHFSPEFLFVRGDAPLHHAPDFGLMYPADSLLLFSGIVVYLLYFRSRKSAILPIWLLIAPLPAAVTWQAPHSVRAEIILPTLQIFSAIGFVFLLTVVRRELGSRVFFLIHGALFLLIVWQTGAYLHQYYLHTNAEFSKNWMYGRKEAVAWTEKTKNSYEKVLVSLRLEMPHMFWLYYTQYSPKQYVREGGTVSGGFADERNHFDSYEFRNFDYHALPKDKRYLLVGLPKDFPPDAHILHTIYYKNGEPAILIGENRYDEL